VISICPAVVVPNGYQIVASDQGFTTSRRSFPFTLTAPVITPTSITYMVGNVMYFTDTTQAVGSPIAARAWQFEDGVKTGKVVTHAYVLPGAYTVTLRVTDTCGYAGTSIITITIPAPNITASIRALSSTVESGIGVWYSITVCNSGPGAASGIRVWNSLPNYMTQVDPWGNICPCSFELAQAYKKWKAEITKLGPEESSRFIPERAIPNQLKTGNACGPFLLSFPVLADNLTLLPQHCVNISYRLAVARPITHGLGIANAISVTYAQAPGVAITDSTNITATARAEISLPTDYQQFSANDIVWSLNIANSGATRVKIISTTNSNPAVPPFIFVGGDICKAPECRKNWIDLSEVWTYKTTVTPPPFHQLVSTVTVTAQDSIGRIVTATRILYAPRGFAILPLIFNKYKPEYKPAMLVTKTAATTARIGEPLTYTLVLAYDDAKGYGSSIEGIDLDDYMTGTFTIIAKSGQSIEQTIATVNFGPPHKIGNSNDALEKGERWIYTGTYQIPVVKPGAIISGTLVNRVAITGKGMDQGKVLADGTFTTTLCPTYIEDFSPRSLNPWPTKSGYYGYENEQYFVQAVRDRYTSKSKSSMDSSGVFTLEASVNWDDIGYAYGIFFNEIGSSFSFFEVDPIKQQFRLACFNGDQWICSGEKQRRPWLKSSRINYGIATNRLTIVCDGTNVKLYINKNDGDEPVWAEYMPLCMGRMGFITKRDNIGAKADFDNFKLICPCNSLYNGAYTQTNQQAIPADLLDLPWNP
jgi:PKD repeat protein